MDCQKCTGDKTCHVSEAHEIGHYDIIIEISMISLICCALLHSSTIAITLTCIVTTVIGATKTCGSGFYADQEEHV